MGVSAGEKTNGDITNLQPVSIRGFGGLTLKLNLFERT